MKKIIPILLSMLLLAGCKINADIRPDTIVDIPLELTEAVTEPVTKEVTEATEPVTEPLTEPSTEVPTESPTEKATEKPKSTSKNTSSKKPSSGGSSKKENTSKATEPPTQPPTQPPTEAPAEAPTKPAVSSYSPTRLDKAIIAAVNAQRSEAGLSELDTSKKLSNAAAQRACELSVCWDHVRPDGSDFSTVYAQFGISCTDPAENLFFDVSSVTADTVVSRWMDSDRNRSNILAEDARTIGVASYIEDGIVYIAALFIR